MTHLSDVQLLSPCAIFKPKYSELGSHMRSPSKSLWRPASCYYWESVVGPLEDGRPWDRCSLRRPQRSVLVFPWGQKQSAARWWNCSCKPPLQISVVWFCFGGRLYQMETWLTAVAHVFKIIKFHTSKHLTHSNTKVTREKQGTF